MTDTRKRILDAAREAFNRDGIGRVGVRDVARATDMSPGNLAYHFPTKDELVTALVGELHDLNRSTAFVEPMASFSLESLYRPATAAMRTMLAVLFVLVDSAASSSKKSKGSERGQSQCQPRGVSRSPRAFRASARVALERAARTQGRPVRALVRDSRALWRRLTLSIRAPRHVLRVER